jgi:hypothetical protein
MGIVRSRCIAFAVLAAVADFGSEANAGATRWCGGNGGDKTLKLSCSSGKLVIGIAGQGASFLDDIGILCGTQQSDGDFEQSGDWKRGPKKVLPEGSGICNSGRAVTHLSSRAQLFVDRITQAWCSNCTDDHCFDSVSQFTINAGGGNDNAGQRCDMKCPEGEGVHAVEVRYGAWIDAIRVHCRKP